MATEAEKDVWTCSFFGVSLTPTPHAELKNPVPGNSDVPETAADRQWADASAGWKKAAQTVQGQLDSLKSALLKSADPDLVEIAKDDVDGICDDVFDTISSLMRIVGTSASNLEPKVAAPLLDDLAWCRDEITKSETVRACDTNPFSQAVTIEGLLIPAINALTTALKHRTAGGN